MTAHDTPESVAELLRALDDETMCFDGPGTYALVGQAADAIEAQAAELRIVRSDAANAIERAQRAEARNVILRGKDTYDLPAVLERANRLQAEVDELRFERDPRNASLVTKRVRAKAAEANKAREATEARATHAEAALASSEKDRQVMRKALEKARPLIDAVADEASWTEMRPDGPGTPFDWYLHSAAINPDDATSALSAIDAALSTQPAAQPVAQDTTTCTTCQGNGEVVTDWERYLHPKRDDVGDGAVAGCPNCDGIGTVAAGTREDGADA